MSTNIEWADETWNPITGCTKASEGCANCYAERMARRLAGRFGYSEAPHHFDVTVHEDKMDQPLRWKKPRRVLVVSMGDLFHEDVPTWAIDIVFLNMRISPQHTFLILTKRPRWMHYLLSGPLLMSGKTGAELYPNVMLGVTAENQQRADERIPILLSIPAAGHFVSLEPMLGAINLELACCTCPWPADAINTRHLLDCPCSTKTIPLDWVIVGGESGPGARPMHPQWARSVRDQCQEAGVPFLFKQWGAWGRRGERSITLDDGLFGAWIDDAPGLSEWREGTLSSHGEHMVRVGKKRAGRLLDGVLWDEYPEMMR